MTERDEVLREALAARPVDAPSEACPTSEALLAAYTGEASVAERHEVIAHLAACAACAEAWRLARELLPGEVPAAGEAAPRPARVRRGPWALAPTWLAAAAALVVALAGLFLVNRAPTPGWREGDTPEIRALLDDDAAVSRGECRLRWSFPVAGARFTVRVSDEELRPVASARELAEAEVLVPESVLGDVPSGARLLWQVDARLPEGGHVASKTFRVRLR